MLPVNQVLLVGEVRKRLLLCDTELAIWIDIDSDTALPERILVSELERLLMDGELECIADPFLDAVMREVEEYSLDQQKRDAAWEMLADTVQDPGLFERGPRGRIVRAIMVRYGVTNQKVYRLLRRYWQRGMCKNDVPPVLSSRPIWSPIPPDQEIGREEAIQRRADHQFACHF